MVFERRATEGRADRAPALIAELIRLRVDVLVVVGTPVARAAKEATTTIPIVMANASDPVASGLVASLARPGGDITGMTDFEDDLYPKRLELLKAAAPRIGRVAFVQEDYTRRLDAAKLIAMNKEQEAAAQSLGISLLRVLMNTPQDFESATATIVRERADALLLGGRAAHYVVRKEMAEFSIRQRLPSITTSRPAGSGGALISYGADHAYNFRTVATYVAKMLNGATPADLPVERPTKLELIINLKTAKAIGLTIPQSLLLRADEVIR